jgi:hypothetical protein
MDAKTKVSKFFNYGELIYCDKRLGIDNSPTPAHLENLTYLANTIADPAREFVGGPLHGYFYRSEALNNVTPGSAKPSFHMLGMAVDLDCDRYGVSTNALLFQFIRENLNFAQMIWEFGTETNPDWIHVTAFKQSRGVVGGLTWNQKKLTRAIKENGKTIYKPFDL